MAPRSPTHAFDPTPALEHDRRNFSPLNQSSTDNYSNHASSKGVHFSSPPMPPVARHSIATTNVPLLPSVPSASQVPKQAFRITAPSPGIDINAYIENCRNLNEQLRQAHETERRAWNIERTALQARIADLEFNLKKGRDPKRRSSNDSSAASAQSFRSDFRFLNSSNARDGSRTSSDSALISGPPVWRGPESTPPATRVFSHDDDLSHLPSISEDEPFPSLSKEVSPTNKGAFPIPIEQIDKTLDGITLKSTGPALTSSFVAKIGSPQFSSPTHSPSPRPRNSSSTAGLTVEMDSLLDPLDAKLKRHAGHTPMAFDGGLSTSATSTNIPSPIIDQPPEPAPTVQPPLRPSENSDSYFSSTEILKAEKPSEENIPEDALEPEAQFETEDDPPLTGPLMLDPSAKSQGANAFLDQVDAKLLEAASHRDRSASVLSGDGESVPAPPPATGIATNGSKTEDVQSRPGEGEGEGEQQKAIDDDMPQLKMKASTNFGSAWGGGVPGLS